eukprot:1350676-Amorphochlora_amoeboformis.AAC.1
MKLHLLISLILFVLVASRNSSASFQCRTSLVPHPNATAAEHLSGAPVCKASFVVEGYKYFFEKFLEFSNIFHPAIDAQVMLDFRPLAGFPRAVDVVARNSTKPDTCPGESTATRADGLLGYCPQCKSVECPQCKSDECSLSLLAWMYRYTIVHSYTY